MCYKKHWKITTPHIFTRCWILCIRQVLFLIQCCCCFLQISHSLSPFSAILSKFCFFTKEWWNNNSTGLSYFLSRIGQQLGFSFFSIYALKHEKSWCVSVLWICIFCFFNWNLSLSLQLKPAFLVYFLAKLYHQREI